MTKLKYYLRFIVCVIRVVAIIIGVGIEPFGYAIIIFLLMLYYKYC